MGQLYSIGQSPIGQNFNILPKLFESQQLEMLNNIRSGEQQQLQDLQESFINNQSFIAPGPSLKSTTNSK